MTTDVNVLLRGQSNALLFDYDGGSAALEKAIEAKLPDVNVHVIAQYYQTDNTIYSGTAFLDWPKDGEQQGLLNVLKAESADMRDNPTITLWMHNEADGNNSAVTTDGWVSLVQEDATLVRDALGQSAATTPYVFTYVPYAYSAGNSPAHIQAGMAQLSADSTFNASFANHAMDGLAMDGYPAGSHMGVGDAMTVAARLAEFMTPEVAALAHVGVTTPPVVNPPVVNPPVVVAPPVTGTAVIQTIGSGADSLALKISQDAWNGSATYTVSVDGKQVGGTLTAGAAFGSGTDDAITVKGDLAAGHHTLSVAFTNDVYGGSAATDRNLHIDGVSFNGTALPGATAGLFSNGAADFDFTKAAAPPVVTPPVVTPPVVTPPVVTPDAPEVIHFSFDTTHSGLVIQSFTPGKTVISFDGYGAQAVVSSEGGGDFRITTTSGASDTFHVNGVQALATADYVFA